MIADSARERRSKLAVQERARKAGEAGGVGRPKDNSLGDNASTKLSEPKPRTREAVARENKIPERKLRAAAEASARSSRWNSSGYSPKRRRRASAVVKAVFCLRKKFRKQTRVKRESRPRASWASI
jgi:hypothetical protein